MKKMIEYTAITTKEGKEVIITNSIDVDGVVSNSADLYMHNLNKLGFKSQPSTGGFSNTSKNTTGDNPTWETFSYGDGTETNKK